MPRNNTALSKIYVCTKRRHIRNGHTESCIHQDLGNGGIDPHQCEYYWGVKLNHARIDIDISDYEIEEERAQVVVDNVGRYKGICAHCNVVFMEELR